MATYFKQKKGWSFLIWVTDNEGNKKQRRYSGYPTKKDAELAANEISCKVTKGSYIEPVKMSVGKYMLEWFENFKFNLKPTTSYGYLKNIERYIIPYLGSIKLNELKPLHIQEMIIKMHNKGLRPRTISYARGILRKGLNDAIKLEMIEKNPALLVDIPKGKKYEAQFYNNKELIQLIIVAEGKSIQLPILLAAALGLRRGEIIGLQWGDIDFENKIISIRRTVSTIENNEFVITEPKSETSKRQICCPEFIMTKLKDEYRSRVDAKTGRRRMVLITEYVCLKEDEIPYTPNTLSKHFNNLLKENKLKHIRFHDLRHSCASLLIKSGVDMKTTSMILGHSSIGITMDLYSHIDLEQKIDAAERVSKMLRM